MKFTLDGKVAVVAPPNCVACGEPVGEGGDWWTVRDTRAKVSVRMSFHLCAACAAAKQHDAKNGLPRPMGCVVHFLLFGAAATWFLVTSADTNFADYSLGNWAALAVAVAALVLLPAVLLPFFRKPTDVALNDDETQRLALLKQPATLRIKADHFVVKSVELAFANEAFSAAFARTNPLARSG